MLFAMLVRIMRIVNLKRVAGFNKILAILPEIFYGYAGLIEAIVFSLFLYARQPRPMDNVA